MNSLKFYHFASVFLLLMTMVTVSYAGTSSERMGVIESIEDSKDDIDKLKKMRVSGRDYKFNWNTVPVLYKGIYVNKSELRKGMQIKFQTTRAKPDRMVEITILSHDDALLNH